MIAAWITVAATLIVAYAFAAGELTSAFFGVLGCVAAWIGVIGNAFDGDARGEQ